MKKVGILTLPLHINYGGIVQAYALYHTLEDLGYEPYLLNMNGLPKPKRHIPFKQRVKMALFSVAKPLVKLVRPNFVTFPDCLSLYGKKMHGYIADNLPNELIPKSYDELKAAGLYAIVVGSDQVWRKEYVLDIRSFFLSFAEGWDIRRVAYAASFGKSDWSCTPEEVSDCARLVKMFNGVSVREEDGVRMCSEILGTEAVCTLDPTMLLSPADYAKTFEGEAPKNTLVTYILDRGQTENDIVAALEKELSAKSYPLLQQKFSYDKRKVVMPINVDEWLSAIAGAGTVFTNSFHGCVFSIIFNRPFIVIVNSNRGSARFCSLLSKFGLESRLVSTSEDALRIVHEPIDWKTINAKRAALREESLKFLTEALKGK